MMENPAIAEIFSAYHDYLKMEQDIREEIRSAVQSLEQTAREILITLQKIHQSADVTISQLCDQAENHFSTVRQQYQALSQIIPKDQYYRFHDHWRFVNQRLCFLAALLVYLKNEQLITKSQVATMLGVAENRDDGFHIDLEDFLIGLLSLANELARFSVNSVTAGDFSRPVKIAKFVGDMNAGFRLLNLKNDSLRKRFDALKYDVKKIEEVVYDLSIRGLKPPDNTAQEVQALSSKTDISK